MKGEGRHGPNSRSKAACSSGVRALRLRQGLAKPGTGVCGGPHGDEQGHGPAAALDRDRAGQPRKGGRRQRPQGAQGDRSSHDLKIICSKGICKAEQATMAAGELEDGLRHRPVDPGGSQAPSPERAGFHDTPDK